MKEGEAAANGDHDVCKLVEAVSEKTQADRAPTHVHTEPSKATVRHHMLSFYNSELSLKSALPPQAWTLLMRGKGWKQQQTKHDCKAHRRRSFHSGLGAKPK